MAEVSRHVSDAADASAERHPNFDAAIRRSFGRLREDLTLAHARHAGVESAAWSRYVTDLDAGLDELDKEIGRAAESGGDVDDVLTIHTNGLALKGWRLQVSLPGLEPRLTAAELALQQYVSACATGTAKPVGALEEAMTHVRAAA